MKKLGVLLFALLVAPPLGAEEAIEPILLDPEPLASPAASTCVAAAQLGTAAPEKVALADGCTEVCVPNCHCVNLDTGPVTRVGATCPNAQNNASNAALALAVCPPDFDPDACLNSPTTVSVSGCTPLTTGGYSATATAYYTCFGCFEKCRYECQPPPL